MNKNRGKNKNIIAYTRECNKNTTRSCGILCFALTAECASCIVTGHFRGNILLVEAASKINNTQWIQQLTMNQRRKQKRRMMEKSQLSNAQTSSELYGARVTHICMSNSKTRFKIEMKQPKKKPARLMQLNARAEKSRPNKQWQINMIGKSNSCAICGRYSSTKFYHYVTDGWPCVVA